MSKIDRKTLKSYFQSGKIPTEEQFADLIDSIPNLVDDKQPDNNDVNLSGIEVNAIHRITLRETIDSPVAWTFALTPGRNLSLANEKGEVLVEFMQDKSIMLHGLVIRPEEKSKAFHELNEGTPSTDTDSLNIDTLETTTPLVMDNVQPLMEEVHDTSEETAIPESSASNTEPSASNTESSKKVDKEDNTYAVLDPMNENGFTLPADTEWYSIPIDLENKISMHIKAAVYELGQALFPETEANLVMRGNKSYSVKSSQKSNHGWLGNVDIRWNMGKNELQVRSKKFVALGEVKCQIQDGKMWD